MTPSALTRSALAAAGSATALLALGLAGCAQPGTTGFGSGAPAPLTSTSNTPATTPAPATPAPTTPAPSTTSPTSAATGTRCASGVLRISVTPGDNASGHLGLKIVFTNTSSRTCTMYGYPGVSFLTSAGHQINDPASRSTGEGPPALVSVPPGQAAHADVLLVDVAVYAGSSGCQPTTSAQVRVYPPDEYTALYAPTAQRLCTVKGTGVPVVYPVRAGATGS